MEAAVDFSPEARALGRIRRLSRPIAILLSIALAFSIAIPVAQIAVLLFLANHLGSLRAFVSFTGWGVGVTVVGADQHLQSLTRIPLDSLSIGLRLAIAGLAAVCAACIAVALNQLRRLFVLYSSGVVFAENNIRCIKDVGLWIAAAAVAANLSGRIFARITHLTPEGIANAAMAVVLGAMIYVIAHVMELGREADLDRKDFI